MPIRNNPLTFNICLYSRSTGELLTNPTLQPQDFQVSTDGGAFANLSSAPTVSPASSGVVRLQLSSSEVGNDSFTVRMEDVSGGEWISVYYHETVTPECDCSGSGGSGAYPAVLSGKIEKQEISAQIVTANLNGEITRV